MTDEQIREFVNKARASGMSETDIERTALAQGYSAADVTKMRQRISALSSTTGKTTPPDTSSRSVSTGRVQSGEMAAPQAPLVNSTPTALYGASLFSGPSKTFEPNLRLPTPKNYILGPDDKLVIDVYGYSQRTYTPTVTPEGTIRFENLSPINVGGLTIEEAKERIISRLRQIYEGLNSGGGTSATITLGAVRSIKVIVTGEVVRPGTYTISSLASLFNVLYEAGGPSSNGSFRTINVIRNNKIVRTLDLYDFLLRADQKDNIRLEDQDVVRVEDYQTRVALTGQVKRPFVYELKPNETLKDLLGFAGGFTDQAYTFTIGLTRNTPKERKLLNISQDEIATFIPQNGDRFSVGTILDRIENQVSIDGAVFRPGKYALEDGLRTLKDLISKAEGLREDAFLDRATIIRENTTLDPTNISVDLRQLLNGQLADIPLQRQDVVIIRSINDLREKRTVSILGAVNRGGSFPFVDNMSISDLITQSGGFNESAISSRIEVARRLKDGSDTTGIPSTQNMKLFEFEIDKTLHLSTQDAAFKLKPFDIVTVRSSPRYESQKFVKIEGEVYYPGYYTLKESAERISDLIRRAGGLKPMAYTKGSRFYRSGTLVALELDKIIDNPSIGTNLLLQNGDSLKIEKISATVSIQGAVSNNLTVGFNANKTVKGYISQAGGWQENADKRRVFVVYPNGYTDRTRVYFGVFRKYPSVLPGSAIQVPSMQDKKSKLSSQERITLFTSIASVLTLSVVGVLNFLK
ncbi:MAG: SLBB domain-containing protein [Spirosomataceae bacterium]